VPPRRDRNLQRAIGGQRRAVQGHILVDGHAAVPPVARADEIQPRLALGDRGQRLLLVARGDAALLRHDPDLEEVDGLGLARIIFAMLDARAGRHALELAGADHRTGADAVLMFERAFQHVGDDLHVGMRVAGEASTRDNSVLVDHA
jgi:hypothetical protein